MKIKKVSERERGSKREATIKKVSERERGNKKERGGGGVNG